MSPGVLDRAFLLLAHPMLDLGKDLFDRIEIRRIRWQVPKSRSSFPDQIAHGGRLVATEIVHDDNVAGLQRRDKLLLDISTERLAVDRPVEDTWRHQPISPESPEEGECPPMAMWGQALEAFALDAPAIERRHVGLDPGFVNEDQSLWIEPSLPGSPALTPTGRASTGLLKGEHRFF